MMVINYLFTAVFLSFLPFVFAPSTAVAAPSLNLPRTAEPVFPSQPPSCPICQASYPSISHCAEASDAFTDPSQILLDPQAFISVIECSCTDTFQSVFPQCVDCFIQTNQSGVLTPTQNLPSIVTGMRSICVLGSAILGNVSASEQNHTTTATSSTWAPTSTWTPIHPTSPGLHLPSSSDAFPRGTIWSAFLAIIAAVLASVISW
ncbi:hypothetical protein BOTBODRAFT_138257 [Botryobasidium botryosum FD-172 SS1]|uniref:Extracellular membrane protein CFEM domain-containing protein n=1 Tax=Botryobasidium botryosum (strain FD-172 SS1) TaxID=930990 RepID=A0A067M072_BOTB1|nr:hypothetical protein BOTBODRAFT_138257 [Botryobasidium botryosum FD-172 SS1]